MKKNRTRNKRIILFFTVMVLSLSVSFGAFGQSNYDFVEGFQAPFQQFASVLAPALPYASTIGLQWSHAYIGQLINLPPHFGIGVSAGAVMLPLEGFNKVTENFGVEIPQELMFLGDLGIPFPAAVIDARLGGIILPFDLGFKIGLIPEPLKEQLGDQFTLDYLMVGGDIRVPLLKDKGFVPAISIGAGYTYFRGGVGIPGLLGGGLDLGTTDTGYAPLDAELQQLSFSDPELTFNWESHVIDLKAQLSKNLFIITPYIGLGASYGISQAGGGLTSEVLYGGSPITDAQIQDIYDAFGGAGMSAPELSDQGLLVSSSANGFAFRAYGGTSINIFFIKVDVSVMYNVTSNSLGAQAGVRFQL